MFVASLGIYRGGHEVIPQRSYIMAIINSMGVGRAKKSMGNVTYRTVRGRTIGSQKVSPSGVTTRVPSAGQVGRRAVFGQISRFVAARAVDIKASFDTTRYGSARNYFMRVNYDALAAALVGVSPTATDAEVANAIKEYASAHQTAIYRVKRAGYPVEYLTGEWKSSSNPATGVLSVGGVNKPAGGSAFKLSTGDNIKVSGSNLSGALSVVMANELGGATNVYAEETAFDNVVKTDSQYTATVKAAVNGKYLVSIKVGNYAIANYSNTSGGQGSNPLG